MGKERITFRAETELMDEVRDLARTKNWNVTQAVIYCLAKEVGWSEPRALELVTLTTSARKLREQGPSTSDPFRVHRPDAHSLNEAPSSKVAAVASKLLKKAAALQKGNKFKTGD